LCRHFGYLDTSSLFTLDFLQDPLEPPFIQQLPVSVQVFLLGKARLRVGDVEPPLVSVEVLGRTIDLDPLETPLGPGPPHLLWLRDVLQLLVFLALNHKRQLLPSLLRTHHGEVHLPLGFNYIKEVFIWLTDGGMAPFPGVREERSHQAPLVLLLEAQVALDQLSVVGLPHSASLEGALCHSEILLGFSGKLALVHVVRGEEGAPGILVLKPLVLVGPPAIVQRALGLLHGGVSPSHLPPLALSLSCLPNPAPVELRGLGRSLLLDGWRVGDAQDPPVDDSARLVGHEGMPHHLYLQRFPPFLLQHFGLCRLLFGIDGVFL